MGVATRSFVLRDDPVLGARWDVAVEREQGAAEGPTRERHAVGAEAWSHRLSATLAGRNVGPEAHDAIALAPAVRMLAARTPTLPPATHTNTYVVGYERALLVEPAPADEGELARIVRWLEALRDEGVTIAAIVLTHHHGDHVAGASALRSHLGVPLWAHEGTIARLATTLAIDGAIEDDARFDTGGGVTVRALHTPGHAPGHLCFVEEQSRVVLAGDMVAGTGTILVEPHDGDMAAYLASLERLASLDARALAPAHGGAMRSPGEVLARYVAHRLAREAKVLGALRAARGSVSAAALVASAYDDAPRSVWAIAALSVEAHLVKLARDGLARRVEQGWRATG